MKKKIIFILLIPFVFIQCKKTDIPVSSVISNLSLSNLTPLADGLTVDTATVLLNNDAYTSKRYVIFKISGALDSRDTAQIIIAPANFINGQLTASTIFTMPLQASLIHITASPVLDSFDERNFTLEDSVYADTSLANTIILNPSGFGIETNYANQILITGILKNFIDNPVSLGCVVSFQDSVIGDPTNHGSFNNIINISDSSSQVSTLYSIYSGQIGSKIIIKAFLLNSLSLQKPIYDSTILTITQ